MLLTEIVKGLGKKSKYMKTRDAGNRIDLKCTYENGNIVKTGFNGTIEEARKYFEGKTFNLGDGEKDKMVKCVKVETNDSKTKDSDVIININMEKEAGKIRYDDPIQEKPIESLPVDPGNTEGTVYKGYTIKQEDDGTFNVYSIGGVLIGTLLTLEEAINRINGISGAEYDQHRNIPEFKSNSR